MQKNAMASLNEAASLMKGAMDQMMSGGGQSGGMMSLMQQLQQNGPTADESEPTYTDDESRTNVARDDGTDAASCSATGDDS